MRLIVYWKQLQNSKQLNYFFLTYIKNFLKIKEHLLSTAFFETMVI